MWWGLPVGEAPPVPGFDIFLLHKFDSIDLNLHSEAPHKKNLFENRKVLGTATMLKLLIIYICRNPLFKT